MKDYNDNDIVDAFEMNGSNDIEMRATFPLLENNFLQSDKMKDTTLSNWIEIDNVIYELRKCEKWKCEKCVPSLNGLTVDSNENDIYGLVNCDFERDEFIATTAIELENDVAEAISENSSNTDSKNISVSEENRVENKRGLCSVCNGCDASKGDSKTNDTSSIARCTSDSLESDTGKHDTKIEENNGSVEASFEGLLDNQQSSMCHGDESEASTGKDESCIKTSESLNGNLNDKAVLDADNTHLADDLLSAINNPNLFSDCEDSDEDVFHIETRTTTTLPQCANYFRTRTKGSGKTQSESAILDNLGEETDKAHHLTVSDSAIISALSKRTTKSTADSGARKKSVHFAIFPYVIEIPRVSDLEREFLETEREKFGNLDSFIIQC